MELREIKKGRYTLDGMLNFTTNQGEIKMKAKEALEIAYTLVDYCNVDYIVLNEVETRLLDLEEMERR